MVSESGTSEFFLEEINSMVDSGLSILEAIAEFADKNEVEVETIAAIIEKNVPLKAKLREECEDLNLIEGSARLPL